MPTRGDQDGQSCAAQRTIGDPFDPLAVDAVAAMDTSSTSSRTGIVPRSITPVTLVRATKPIMPQHVDVAVGVVQQLDDAGDHGCKPSAPRA